MESNNHFLAEISQVLSSSLDYTATLKTVVRLAVPRIADWCAVYLIDERGRTYIAEVTHANAAKSAVVQRLREKYRPRTGLTIGVDYVIETGKTQLISEVTDELIRQHSMDAEHRELLRQLELTSVLLTPLKAGGQTFGALGFATVPERRLDSEDVGFAQDIANRAALAIQNAKLYSEAQEALRMRDDVLRTVSHDLRNPVSSIQLTTHLLSMTSLPEDKRREIVEIIRRSVQRMRRLIEDLTTIARVREGQEIPLDVHLENPGDIVEEVCAAFGFQAAAKGIDLRYNKTAMLPDVNLDHGRIVQVLSNLLDNAIKFTSEGGAIAVSCEPHEDGVRFAVKDSGRGIDEQDLARMFDLYWQAKSTAHLGAGFGLAIAKAIVSRHQGRIWAESQPGVGTTVFFTIPKAGASGRQAA